MVKEYKSEDVLVSADIVQSMASDVGEVPRDCILEAVSNHKTPEKVTAAKLEQGLVKFRTI